MAEDVALSAAQASWRSIANVKCQPTFGWLGVDSEKLLAGGELQGVMFHSGVARCTSGWVFDSSGDWRSQSTGPHCHSGRLTTQLVQKT